MYLILLKFTTHSSSDFSFIRLVTLLFFTWKSARFPGIYTFKRLSNSLYKLYIIYNGLHRRRTVQTRPNFIEHLFHETRPSASPALCFRIHQQHILHLCNQPNYWSMFKALYLAIKYVAIFIEQQLLHANRLHGTVIRLILQCKRC